MSACAAIIMMLGSRTGAETVIPTKGQTPEQIQAREAAVAGAVVGGSKQRQDRRKQAQSQQQQAQQQSTTATQSADSASKQAFSACMSGKGYSITS